jgi:hypothetical protein
MALPTSASIVTAVQSIFNAAANVKTHYASPKLSQALDEVIGALEMIYAPFAVTIPGGQATLTPLFAGGLLAAKQAASVYGAASTSLPQVSLQVGDCFIVAGATDTTNTALATAKGSAPAANDVFSITNVSAPAVTFVGNTALSTALGTTYLYQTFVA